MSAIVTGGARGIGAAICSQFLKKGYRVCVADIQVSEAEKFVKQQQTIYGKEKAIAIRCDVTKESEYAKLFEHTLKHFQNVDVLINNAGIMLEQDPRKCLEVNLLGTTFGCHAALKYMGKSNGGHGGVVINTASIAGFIPTGEVPVYTASKHGVIGLTRSFGLPFHYNRDEIIFAALCPFFVDTPMLNTTNKTLDLALDLTKCKDIMTPEYVAKGVLKILEDKINGSTLCVLPEGYYYEVLEERFKKLML